LYLGTNDRIQYFHVTDEECSVDQITEKAREGFGNDNLILVQANGLKVEDSDVTKGIKYTLYYISNVNFALSLRILIFKKSVSLTVPYKFLRLFLLLKVSFSIT